MGLLLKNGDHYRTEPSAAPLLSSDAPNTILPMLLHSGRMWKTWSSLTEIAKETGRPEKPSSENRSKEDLRAFIGAMRVIGATLADPIVSTINSGNARFLLDVGGGPGIYTIAFLRASNGLKATLFDDPAVLEMARANLASAGLLDRVTLAPGDFYKNDLPSGHDLALLSAIIHQNSLKQNIDLYRKVHAALIPGGRLIIRDHVMKPNRLHPVAGALFAVNMLVATEGGGTYTFEEIEAGLKEAGFVRIKLLQETHGWVGRGI